MKTLSGPVSCYSITFIFLVVSFLYDGNIDSKWIESKEARDIRIEKILRYRE